MNIEIRKLTPQERESYAFCPCCGSRIKPQTVEELVATVMRGFAEAAKREKEERKAKRKERLLNK